MATEALHGPFIQRQLDLSVILLFILDWKFLHRGQVAVFPCSRMKKNKGMFVSVSVRICNKNLKWKNRNKVILDATKV